VKALAEFLGMTRARFEREYTFVDGGWRELLFHGNECVFLTREGTCGVYPARPTQCRTFPFWPDLVRGGRWARRAHSLCEGVGEGKLFSPEEVAARVQEYRDAQQDEE
jgi:Fe-S-cluster containining protein